MKDILDIIEKDQEQPLDYLLFSKDYCSLLDDFPNLSPLQVNHWDTFRDLNKIIGAQFCKDNLIGLE